MLFRYLQLDFTNLPAYIDNIYCNTLKVLDKGIHCLTFTDSSSESQYGYLLGSLQFGSNLASYITPTDFINIAEDENLNVFTFQQVSDTNSNLTNTIIVKEIDLQERSCLVEYIKQRYFKLQN